MCLVTFVHILSTSLLFVFFAIFRTVFKLKKKVCFSKKFCNLKSFLNRFRFLIYLKMITVISNLLFLFSHTQIHKFHFKLMDTIFDCFSHFSGFSSQSNSHSEDLFLILRNTGFYSRFYIWIVTSLKSTKVSIDTTVLSRLFILR